jgi:uncharacterized membrane protein YgcG
MNRITQMNIMGRPHMGVPKPNSMSPVTSEGRAFLIQTPTDLPPSQVRFGVGRKWFYPAVLLSALLPACSSDKPEATPAKNGPAKNYVFTHDDDIDETKLPKDGRGRPVVNKASDLPGLNINSKQLIYQSKQNPALRGSQLHDREVQLQMLFEDLYGGPVKVLISPGKDRDLDDTRSPKQLTIDFLNQLKLGKANEEISVLIYIDQDRLDNLAPPGIIQIEPGTGLRDRVDFKPTAIQIFKPLAEQYQTAKKRGDKAEAERLQSEALKAVIDDVGRQIKAYRKDNNLPNRELTAEEKAEQAQKEASFRNTLLAGAAALLLLFGIGIVVIPRELKKRRIRQAVETVVKPLLDMKSPHKVTPENVYSVDTLNALLDLDKGKQAKPKELVTAIGTVLDGMDFTKVAKKDVVQSLVSKGLVHPHKEVRLKTIAYTQQYATGRELFNPFMTMLKAEHEDEVIKALHKPLTELAQADDVPKFLERLEQSTHPGVRALSVNILAKFRDDNTLTHFFTALEKESDSDMVVKLQEGIVKVVAPNQSATLIERMNTGKIKDVRVAALKGIEKLAGLSSAPKAAYFEPVFKAYAKDRASTLKADYTSTLQACVSPASLPVLYEGLTGALKMQDVSIALLGHLKSGEAVKPLMAYLQTADTQLPAEATAVIVDSLAVYDPKHPTALDPVTQANRDYLLEVIDSYDPKTEDKEPMMAAIRGIQRIAHPEDLDNLAHALETESLSKGASAHITRALQEAMDETAQTDVNYAFLCELLKTGKTEAIRNAAVLSLDDYGVEALRPLFDALEKTTRTTTESETDVLKKAIAKVGRNDDAVPIFREALGRKGKVKNAAEAGLLNLVAKWQKAASEADAEVAEKLTKLARGSSTNDRTAKEIAEAFVTPSAGMSKLVEISGIDHRPVQQEASQIVSGLLAEKVQVVQAVGQSGKYSDDHANFTLLETLKKNTDYPDIAQAAREAESDLKRKLKAYKEQQEREAAIRRQQAADAALEIAAAILKGAAEAAASSSRSSGSSGSSWPSGGGGGGGSDNTSGGYGGGGGGGTGGGFGW